MKSSINKKSQINPSLNSTTGRLKQPGVEKQRKLKIFITSLLIAMFPEISEETIQKDIAFLMHLQRTRGSLYLIRYLKALEEVLNKPNRDHNFVGISIGITKSGIVRKLSNQQQMLYHNGNISAMRYLHTLIKMKDLFTAHTTTDFASVTGGYTGEKDPSICESMNSDFKANARSLAAPYHRLKKTAEYQMDTEEYADKTAPKLHTLYDPFPHYYVSRKSGPNGESLYTRFQDCKAIEDENLVHTLNKFTYIYTDKKVSDHFSDNIKDVRNIQFSKQVKSARLHILLEEGKTKPRIIGIIDGLTQQALRPYHEALMCLLQTIPEDCTFSQGDISNHAKRWHKEKRSFYGSTDLSSATDRIPKVLYEMVGDTLQEDLGRSWVNIFNRAYDIQHCNNVSKTFNRNTKDISYTVGQPMGALSSWPKMAVVHHVLVWTAAGGRNRASGKYALLGDDIVIVDPHLSEKYNKLLQHYGVGFTKNNSTNRFEFAKRRFIDGIEVSGIPLKALYTNCNQPIVFAMEYAQLANRGYTVAKYPDELTSGPGEILKKLFSKRDLKKIKTLLLVPGTNAPPSEVASWVLHLNGRSCCHLRDDTNIENALKPFRQVAGLILSDLAKAKFSKLLLTSETLQIKLKEEVIKSLELHGIIGGLDPNLTKLVDEHTENTALIMGSYIFRLERDYKKFYTDPSTEAHILLRPRVKKWLYPLEIDRSVDATKAVMRLRGKYLLRLQQILRMTP